MIGIFMLMCLCEYSVLREEASANCRRRLVVYGRKPI